MDVVDKVGELWEHAAKKYGDNEATKIMAHMGMDNPRILETRSLEECKALIDKFMMMRNMKK